MKTGRNLILLLFTAAVLQGCNTLYSFNLIDIEVVEPAKLMLPQKYSTAVVRYNNTANANIFNPGNLPSNASSYADTLNPDTLAAKIYFGSAVENLKNQFYFDTLIVLPPSDFATRYFSDSLFQVDKSDTSQLLYPSVEMLAGLLQKNEQTTKEKYTTKYLDPKLGLYTSKELKKIADATHADLFISLDYFETTHFQITQKLTSSYFLGNVTVISGGLWNFYNLKTGEPEFFYYHQDTLMWNTESEFLRYAAKELPPRKDAVLNAADVMGIRWVQNLFPHWVEVQRLYYTSGQVELKTTEQMVKEGKWLDAAIIWKANVNNPNKNIAAKSMFNLAVACEMQGDLEAALDWVIKSYQVFGNKNQVHSDHCIQYITILGQRKLDLKLIEKQVTSAS